MDSLSRDSSSFVILMHVCDLNFALCIMYVPMQPVIVAVLAIFPTQGPYNGPQK